MSNVLTLIRDVSIAFLAQPAPSSKVKSLSLLLNNIISIYLSKTHETSLYLMMFVVHLYFNTWQVIIFIKTLITMLKICITQSIYACKQFSDIILLAEFTSAENMKDCKCVVYLGLRFCRVYYYLFEQNNYKHSNTFAILMCALFSGDRVLILYIFLAFLALSCIEMTPSKRNIGISCIYVYTRVLFIDISFSFFLC